MDVKFGFYALENPQETSSYKEKISSKKFDFSTL